MNGKQLGVVVLTLCGLVAIFTVRPWILPGRYSPPYRTARIEYRLVGSPPDVRLQPAVVCLQLEFVLVLATGVLAFLAVTLKRRFAVLFVAIPILLAPGVQLVPPKRRGGTNSHPQVKEDRKACPASSCGT